MGVYELSGAGNIKTGRTNYTSMNAGNQYGAMVPIASAVGAGAVSGGETVTFVNIPQTYQDLYLVVSGQVVSIVGNPTLGINVNQSNAAVYSSTVLLGNGTTASSNRVTSAVVMYPNGYTQQPDTTTPTSASAHFLNYANSTTNKTMLIRTANDKNGSGYTALAACTVNSTAAINSISISTSWGGCYWTTGSTFTLYGIRASNA